MRKDFTPIEKLEAKFRRRVWIYRCFSFALFIVLMVLLLLITTSGIGQNKSDTIRNTVDGISSLQSKNATTVQKLLNFTKSVIRDLDPRDSVSIFYRRNMDNSIEIKVSPYTGYEKFYDRGGLINVKDFSELLDTASAGKYKWPKGSFKYISKKNHL